MQAQSSRSLRGRRELTLNRMVRRMLKLRGLNAKQVPSSLTQWQALLRDLHREFQHFDVQQRLASHADMLAKQNLEQAHHQLQRERDALSLLVRERANEAAQDRELSGVGGFRLNLATRMLTLSDSFAELLGFEAGPMALSESELLQFVLPADRERFANALSQASRGDFADEIELNIQAKSGDLLYLICRLRSIVDARGQVQRVRGVVVDVTEQQMANVKMRHMAFFDELTHLPNRAHFMDDLARRMERASHSQAPFALLFMDLDGFKEVNDSLGHDSGDELLIEVGARLRNVLREQDVVARFGGDEFAVILDNCADEPTAGDIADMLLSEIARPVPLSSCEVRVSASIGLSFHPRDSMSPKELLKQADMAMYLAKQRGRNRWAAYEASLIGNSRVRLQTIKDIRDAVDHDEFEPYYQPIVDGVSGQIVGFEALARWNHPTRGLLSPVAFIDIAEQHGLIDAIGDVMLYRSARQMQAWREAGAPNLYVSVNVSPSQLTNPEFIKNVEQVIQIYQLPAAFLQLEITESTVMRDPVRGLEALHTLASLGVRLALDDFGTGYSSLSTLQNYPIHTVKLDKSFVSAIESETQAVPLVGAVAAIAASMGLELVAEGVETQAQRARLIDYGYSTMQGYLFFKPMPASAVAVLLGLVEVQDTEAMQA